MWLLLVLLFVVGPIAELYVIIQVADVIGGWQTIALLLIESFLGAWLMKRQGLGAVRRIQTDLRRHQLPADSLTDGMLIVFAGALLLTPGFLTDALGFALLFPLTRAPIRAVVLRSLTARLGVGFATFGSSSSSSSAPAGRRWGRRVVDTTGRPTDEPTGGASQAELLTDDDRRRR